MKKVIYLLLSLSCLTLPLIAQPPKKQPKNPTWLKDQQDQTDTYAIPSDSSEQEEEEEMETLKREQRRK